ncbi:MAG TPA: twin-arginine translocase subunit TatC [Bacillota bacterium]|mgnify:CR=1 FL=1|nr:twin-arginine translocase subunit TatC [Bacillota bacterium]
MSKSKDGTMTVLEHLAELRMRLIISAGGLLAAAIFCFTRISWIRRFLTAPLKGLPLIYLSPPEALTANLRLSFLAGAIIASPLILHQVMAFLFPAFTRREKKFVLIILAGICFLFCCGIFFAYTVVFPFTINFFLQFASERLDPQFTISEYISFVTSFHLAFGLTFQLPLLTWALGRIGLLSSRFLRRNRKYALLIILVVAAVITPPDVISQLVMAGPMFLLYEVGIIMVLASEKRRKKEMVE